MVRFASPWGIGLSPNSVRYIQAAHNFTSGAGLSTWDEADPAASAFPAALPALPGNHCPPACSVLPPGAQLAGAPLCRQYGFARSDCLVVLARQALAGDHRCLYSMPCPAPAGNPCLGRGASPLFLLLATWALFALYRHIEKPQNRWLLCAAGLAALACLARYLGFAVVLAGALVLLLLSRKPLKSRLVDVLVFSAISLLPVSIWLASSALLGWANASACWRTIRSPWLRPLFW